ncbi:hypothetical protein EOA35_20000 [Mesorhizobium sp. M8A.F.Ca.ET.023.01.1.1]|nr:hypothetical protein EOA35_20000 [Mesorhizobium sp. M8A.F.Ca.ET.023.01.1.1]
MILFHQHYVADPPPDFARSSFLQMITRMAASADVFLAVSVSRRSPCALHWFVSVTVMQRGPSKRERPFRLATAGVLHLLDLKLEIITDTSKN